MTYRTLHILYWLNITIGSFVFLSGDTPFEKNLFLSFLCVPVLLCIVGWGINIVTGTKTFLLWPYLTLGAFSGWCIPVLSDDNTKTNYSLLSNGEGDYRLLRYKMFTYTSIPLTNGHITEQIKNIIQEDKL